MSDVDAHDDPTPTTWTAAYRVPIGVASGVLAVLCCWMLVDGGTAWKWVGGIGLAVLVVWVFVFRALYRRGH